MNSVSWLIIITDNYDLSKKFYLDTLGFTLDREVPEEEFCQFKLENCTFAIFGRKNLEKVIKKDNLGKAGGAIYSFPESNDLDKDYEDLKRKGVKFINPPTAQPWGQKTAYFTDPDGHIWELQQWIKRI